MYHYYVGGAILVGLLVRIKLHFFDKTRIHHAAIDQDWSDVSIKWAPFAPGWIFELQERHYRVSYRDAERQQQSRICKTRFFGHVYWKGPEVN